MSIKLENHPCFNPGACKDNGRVHLPIAPACNVQCKYCNRQYDCVNESRPGVVSTVLSPYQSVEYLKKITERSPISVVGIAGPGDPFANPAETLETLEMVRIQFPEMLLCVSTNGLNIRPFIPDLLQLDVSHVTLTINAVDPELVHPFYRWIRYGKRSYRGIDAGRILLAEQEGAIRTLKEAGVLVKVNTVVVPGYNDHHLQEIAETVSSWGADMMNAMAMIPVEGSDFEDLAPPDMGELSAERIKLGKTIRQMNHCQRCRADAAGLLGEKNEEEVASLLKDASSLPLKGGPERHCVAIGTREGMMINRHLGECDVVFVYKKVGDRYQFMEKRATPPRGIGDERWVQLAYQLRDCSHLLVSGVGEKPRNILRNEGISVNVIEGIIEAALDTMAEDGSLNFMKKREKTICGAACSGSGGGCN